MASEQESFSSSEDIESPKWPIYLIVGAIVAGIAASNWSVVDRLWHIIVP